MAQTISCRASCDHQCCYVRTEGQPQLFRSSVDPCVISSPKQPGSVSSATISSKNVQGAILARRIAERECLDRPRDVQEFGVMTGWNCNVESCETWRELGTEGRCTEGWSRAAIDP